MARARNIKPGLYLNEHLAACSIWARYLFPALWMQADREGRFEDRPIRIKAAVMPYDNCDINALLDELQGAGFVVRYQIEGVRYVQIINFLSHQKPHPRELPSIIPPYLGEPQAQPRLDQSIEKAQPGPADCGLPHPSSLNAEVNPAPDKPARFDPLSLDLPRSVSNQAWENWIAYRRKRKLTCNETTIRAQIGELTKWADSGMDAADAIQQSIAKGWQGLFEPKKGNVNGHPNRNEHLANVAAELTGRHRRQPDPRTIDGESNRVDRAPICPPERDVWEGVSRDVGEHEPGRSENPVGG